MGIFCFYLHGSITYSCFCWNTFIISFMFLFWTSFSTWLVLQRKGFLFDNMWIWFINSYLSSSDNMLRSCIIGSSIIISTRQSDSMAVWHWYGSQSLTLLICTKENVSWDSIFNSITTSSADECTQHSFWVENVLHIGFWRSHQQI